MEKKVYEGYKRTSSSKTAAEKSDTDTAVTPKKTTTPKEPRKRTTARLASKSTSSKPRLAMFIDVDNTGITRENLLEILFFANGKYKIELCKLYGFSEETLPGIREFASEYNFSTVGRMKFKQTGINSLDSRLLIDAYECALNNKNKIDMIFVWCYPCDLESLFEKIVNLGINTATIDNSIFDCKNRFVSQTFKLYSPYNFTVEQASYGKVKNEPAVIAPSADLESEPTTPTNPATEPAKPTVKQPDLFDDVVPPVLPRRQIVERSNPNAPKPTPALEAETQPSIEEGDTNDGKTTSLVEEIARKLNLEMPTEEDLAREKMDDTQMTSEIFLDMLKQAGFDDYLNDKPLKYEDTIGDLWYNVKLWEKFHIMNSVKCGLISTKATITK